jgi:hypothetical protein
VEHRVPGAVGSAGATMGLEVGVWVGVVG